MTFQADLLEGRTALVTGGGTGICRGIALAFAAHGGDVAITSRRAEHLEPTVREIEALGRRAVAVTADVRDPVAVEAAVTQAVERLGRLDILVNGAAGNFLCLAENLSPNGFGTVVDIDLKKFFDRVNHDRLMARVAERVSDKRVLKLIRAFLNARVMEDGLVRPTDEGAPQGGPLSPLLSNLVLDEFDQELTRRGHRFCRYADDSNIYVRSRRAGERVMASVCRYLTARLRLKVNESKSAVARPEERNTGPTVQACVCGSPFHHPFP